MATVHATDLGDLVATTLRDFGEPNYEEMATDLQDHVAMSQFLKPSAMEKFGAGIGLQYNLIFDHNRSAANVGMYQSYTVDQRDVNVQAQTNWAFSNFHWAWDANELAMNRSPKAIVKLLGQRRVTAFISNAELMEANFWAAPSASDTDTPLGLPYWVPKNSSATAGLNGTVLSGYSTVANVSPTTYPRWRNWTFIYANVTEDDFLALAREAATKTNFKPAVTTPDIPTHSSARKCGYYTNYNVVKKLELICRAQNENLGNDVSAKDGEVMFRRMPVTWVPYLDADTTNPFYGIDWGTLKLGYLAGRWQVETVFDKLPNQPTVGVVHNDSTYQFFCYNRRRNFVGATAATYP